MWCLCLCSFTVQLLYTVSQCPVVSLAFCLMNERLWSSINTLNSLLWLLIVFKCIQWAAQRSDDRQPNMEDTWKWKWTAWILSLCIQFEHSWKYCVKWLGTQCQLLFIVSWMKLSHSIHVGKVCGEATSKYRYVKVRTKCRCNTITHCFMRPL